MKKLPVLPRGDSAMVLVSVATKSAERGLRKRIQRSFQSLMSAGLTVALVGLASPIRSQTSHEQAAAEWLQDAKGSYTLVAIPKGTEGVHFLRLSETSVQVRNGVQLTVEREDEQYFYVKQYRSRPPVRAPSAAPPKTAERIETEPEDVSEELVEITVSESDQLRFEPFDRGLPRSGQWRNGFDIADMDSDGDLDLLFGAARKSRAEPNLFLSDGQGNWQRWSGRYPSLPYDYGDAAAADFNRDGHMDIALAVHLTGIVVLVSDGRGGYSSWSEGLELIAPSGGQLPAVFSSRAIEVADWNSDGLPDLLALGEGPKGPGESSGGSLVSSPGLRVFLNRGDGSWATLSSDSRLFGDALAVADLSGDGRVDVVTGSRSQRGGGLLHVQTDSGWHQRGLGLTEENRPVRSSSSFVFSVAADDLNGDGQVDVLLGSLVVADETAEVRTFETRVDALFGVAAAAEGVPRWKREPLFFEASRAVIYSLAVGDLNGDGVLDVAWGTGDGRIEVRLGTSERKSFVLEQAPELPRPVAGCTVYDLAIKDLNADGLGELVAAYAGESAGPGGVRSVPGCPGEGALRVWTPRLKQGSD